MTDDRCETLKLQDADVFLYRGIKWMLGREEVATGDRMVVRHLTGNQDDVAIVLVNGRKRARRIVTHMVFGVPASPVLSTSASFQESFAELPNDREKQLLAIYSRFSSDGALNSPPQRM